MTAQPGRDEKPADMLDPYALARETLTVPGETTRERALLKIIEGILPAPASGWQDERPGVGPWWLRMEPGRCASSWTVLAVDVQSVQVWFADGDYLGKLTDDRFTGAKWKRRETLQDPFLSEVHNGK